MLMNRSGKCRSLAVWPLLLALLPVACSRPAGFHGDKAAQSESHQVPFQEGERAGDDSHPAQVVVQASAQEPEARLPFGDPQALPAGTLLTVRLNSPVAADNTGAETFDAVVDEPVLIEGNTMLPRGARVAGRVESARASQVKRDRGYVRLTLNSIDLAGQELPIQTSSLFVRGNATVIQAKAGENQPQVVRLEVGRRLTFRLTESIAIAAESPSPAH
jgi:hypothetical protein